LDNRAVQAAWRYHDGTKHPGGELLNRFHTYLPGATPPLFKRYPDLPAIPLAPDRAPRTVAALAAIGARPAAGDDERVPDLAILARVLHFSAGVTKTIRFPGWGAMPFRAAACTGALYHIELYAVCGELPGLPAGVYHYDPLAPALRRLRAGDYRRVLVDATAAEPACARAPVLLVYSDVFWRNAVKYQAREYRHAWWDSGTILANTLAIAAGHALPARVILGFVDAEVNRLLALDSDDEAALALVALGRARAEPPPAPAVEPIAPRVESPPGGSAAILAPIRAMHAASSLAGAAEVAAWRAAAKAGPVASDAATRDRGSRVALIEPPPDEWPPDALETVIVRRGSARRFARRPIPLSVLGLALRQALAGVPADFVAEGGTLGEPYLIVNAVDGLEPGSYRSIDGGRTLERLRAGDFRAEAGRLGLGQALAADASVAIFFLADLAAVLERLGNRGYRAAQLDASIAAGRLYLAAYALGIAASGLTFFDDLVREFFGAAGRQAMFLIALGHRARGR
jgi:SagB-type dehydrogenase family enzyme